MLQYAGSAKVRPLDFPREEMLCYSLVRAVVTVLVTFLAPPGFRVAIIFGIEQFKPWARNSYKNSGTTLVDLFDEKHQKMVTLRMGTRTIPYPNRH